MNYFADYCIVLLLTCLKYIVIYENQKLDRKLYSYDICKLVLVKKNVLSGNKMPKHDSSLKTCKITLTAYFFLFFSLFNMFSSPVYCNTKKLMNVSRIKGEKKTYYKISLKLDQCSACF